MIITCDDTVSMGYIYLQPPKGDYSENEEKIKEYLNRNELKIPIILGSDIDQRLEKMMVSNHTYNEAKDTREFYEEYMNDKDNKGYMSGVEMKFSKEQFLTLIKKGAYKLYLTKWRRKSFWVASSDVYEKITHPNNIIYPMTAEKDTYLIVDNSTGTASIKALITSIQLRGQWLRG